MPDEKPPKAPRAGGRARVFQPAATQAHVGTTADVPPASTLEPPEVAPAPAVVARYDAPHQEPSTPPYVENIHVNNHSPRRPSGRTIDVTDLMPGRPHPSRDMDVFTVRIPRFLKAALSAQQVTEQRSVQDIVTGVLGRGLDATLVNAAWEKALVEYEGR